MYFFSLIYIHMVFIFVMGIIYFMVFLNLIANL